MFKRIRNMHPLGIFATGVVATLVLSGTAIAVTDTSFTYSTVQNGYLMIAPADLVPAETAYANANYVVNAVRAESSSFACFTAAAHLPQGSRMTSWRTSYRSGAGSDLIFSLFRANPVTGDYNALIPSHTVFDDSYTHTFVKDAVPTNLGLINNALFTYTYRVCVGSDTEFYGARIAYQYTSAGD